MNKVVILAGLNGRPSMRAVYRRLRGGKFIDTKSAYLVYENNKAFLNQHTRTTINADDTKDAIIINWGMPGIQPQNAKRIMNPTSAVSLSSNKGRARRIMHSHGVRVPSPVDRFNYNSATYPLIWRPLYHNKGKGFVVINNPSELEGQTRGRRFLDQGYLSEFIDKDREFRVHATATHGVICVSEKPPQKIKKWNEVEGQEFFEIKEWPEDVETQAVKAIQAIGLSHGGVDVMLKGDKAYVLEINTAPTLYGCEYEIEAYRKYFQSIING